MNFKNNKLPGLKKQGRFFVEQASRELGLTLQKHNCKLVVRKKATSPALTEEEQELVQILSPSTTTVKDCNVLANRVFDLHNDDSQKRQTFPASLSKAHRQFVSALAAECGLSKLLSTNKSALKLIAKKKETNQHIIE